MNIIYLTKEEFRTIRYDGLDKIDLKAFFSAHKKEILFVIDSSDRIVGYMNHATYSKSKSWEEAIIEFTYFIDVKDLPSFNTISYVEKNVDMIPVMDNHRFVGAIVRSYPEELASFDRLINEMALSVIKVFKDDIIRYLKQNSIESIKYIGNSDDYSLLRSTFPEFIWSTFLDGDSVDLIIDSLYSKSYRLTRESTTMVSLEELLTIALIPVLDTFLKDCNVSIHVVEGPMLDKIKNIEDHSFPHLVKSSLETLLSDNNIINTFAVNNSSVIEHLKNIGNCDSVFFNGTNLIMTKSNRGIIAHGEKRVHLYGPCLTYGTCVPVEESISVLLESLIRDANISVMNHAIRSGHSVLNDILNILSTPFHSGDCVILINSFSNLTYNEISKRHKIYELSEVLNVHNHDRWFFLDNTFHINHIGNRLFAKALFELIKTDITMNCNVVMRIPSFFDNANIRQKVDSKRLLERGLLGSYIEYVKSHKRITRENDVVGAVLLTANPITKGHEHLISYAKSKCDILYLFIVEEDAFFFSTVERMFLVHQVINDPNVVILLTGNLMTAKFTFPEYFTKDNGKNPNQTLEISNLHCEIFGRCICPILGITKRFIGEEIKDSITYEYNKKLIELLPTYGIDVVVIPRKKDEQAQIISSSTVREMIKLRDFDNLNTLVSLPVNNYIRMKWSHEN